MPSYSDYRAAIEASRGTDEELDLITALQVRNDEAGADSSELARLWERLNPGRPLTSEIVAWLQAIFRPVLGIRLLREGHVAGAYLLFGEDPLEDLADRVPQLEVLGERLVGVLRQPSRIAEEAARSESLRRLSWMMHQLAGPLSRIGNVVDELMDFADANPQAASTLLPDEERAKKRADMNELPIEEYMLKNRLIKLGEAVGEIRRLRYLIRGYRNAQSELRIVSFTLIDLLDALAGNARGQFAELRVTVDCAPDLVVNADRGLIQAALEEVVSNACRECRVRTITEPSIALTALTRGDQVRLAIEDNALPVDAELLRDVFAEDASTYRSQGKGSGLGLAVVKETFLNHRKLCGLAANVASDGSRRPGVTFWGDLTLGHKMEEKTRV